MDWFSLGISFIIPALREAVKNAEKKAKLRSGALKLAAVVHATFADDEDFQTELAAKTIKEQWKNHEF